jgi:snapalysin
MRFPAVTSEQEHPMTRRHILGTITAALALVATLLGTPAATASGYTPHAGDTAQNARLRAQLAAALADQPGAAGAQAVQVVYYNDSGAPSYQSQIAESTTVWNSSVRSVQLAETSGTGSFAYYEGNDPRGSYASTDGHGNGYVFIDYTQTTTYYPLRVVAHETGHILGLPDHYSGPCSELMSGGGPGPSCTNPYPDATERNRVDALWASLQAARFALAG